MHFAIKFQISWILKWNYVKDGDIIDRHWFVKWWGKFPQTDAIIQTVYKDFAKKSPSEKSTSPAVPTTVPLITTIGLVTPSHFLPPPEEKKVAVDKVPNDKSVTASSSSSKKKKKKGPSKNDMRMFQQFLKTCKEENNVEDSGDEENSNSSGFSLDTTGLCGENRHLFGHDPICTQDALDALDTIPGIEDIPELSYWLSRVHYCWFTLQTVSLAPPELHQKFACLLRNYWLLLQLADNFTDCYSPNACWSTVLLFYYFTHVIGLFKGPKPSG